MQLCDEKEAKNVQYQGAVAALEREKKSISSVVASQAEEIQYLQQKLEEKGKFIGQLTQR